MPITFDGSGTVTGIVAGGLPDGVITTSDLADNSVTYAKVGTTEQSQLCKAWVNFNGTGAVAIRAAYNVSSITDNGVGDYTVNFTTAMPDANYAANFMVSGAAIGNQPAGVKFKCSVDDGAASSQLVGSCRVMYGYGNATTAYDSAQMTLSFFR